MAERPDAMSPGPAAGAPVVWPDASERMLQAWDANHREAMASTARLAVFRADQELSDTDMVARIGAAPIVILGRSLSGNVLNALGSTLRHVVFLGTEPTNFIDLTLASELGVTVHGIRGYGDADVAEHTIALIMAALHNLPQFDAAIRSGDWPRGLTIRSMREVTVGVVGFGGIGGRVARTCQLLGSNVILHTRTSPTSGGFGTEDCVSLEHLMATADVVTLHLPLTTQSQQLIDAAMLGRMKSGSILVNTARSQLVDTRALVTELRAGRLAYAALDVFDVEPVPADSELLACGNTILTPHVGFATTTAMKTLLSKAIELVGRLVAEGGTDAPGPHR